MFFFTSLPSFHSFPPTTTTTIARTTTINRSRLQLTADSSVGNVFAFLLLPFQLFLTIAQRVGEGVMPSRGWDGVVVRHRITQLSKSISQSKTHFSATHENQFTFLPLFSHASLTLSVSLSVSFLVSLVAAALFRLCFCCFAYCLFPSLRLSVCVFSHLYNFVRCKAEAAS